MVTVGIIGARGFTGGELLRLCLQHPDFRVSYVTSESQAGQPVAGAFPTLAVATSLAFESLEIGAACRAAEAFFLALPDGEAMKIAPALLEAGKRVVDVSGDYRVRDRATYEAWYQREHCSPQLLEQAVYGLPELHPEARQARLVANPGCYPTAALLALAPLFRERLVEPDSLVIDAKSGVSGAGGRVGMREEYSFPAVNENLRAYSVVGHRHTAEIEQELTGLLGGGTTALVQAQFTPHLLPLTRGLSVTCYARLAQLSEAGALLARYADFYRDAPFVQITETPPEIKHVAGSNFCRVSLAVDARTRRVIAMAAIDNLGKGAAGQAIQNMNLMLGLEETRGLMAPALYP
jgi:N-acetyl-gamma-glutamyl-phosphate reductase